jgi:hypothetical protein
MPPKIQKLILAQSFIKEKKIGKALRLLKNLDSDEAYFMRGVICEENREHGGADAAIDFYKKTKQHPEALQHWSAILVQRGQYTDALPIIERLLQIEPSHTGALNNIAVCYYQLNNHEMAFHYFNKIIANDPTNANAHHNLGHIEIQRGNVDIAQHHLELSYKLDPTHIETCYTLAVLYNGFTIKRPKLKSADELLMEAQVLYAKSLNRDLIKMDQYNGAPYAQFIFNNVVLSTGRCITSKQIIVSHHHLKIPVHRFYMNDKLRQFDTAWSTLQHNSWGFYHWLIETLPRVFIIMKYETDKTIPILVPDKPFVHDAINVIDPEHKWNFVYCANTDSFIIKTVKLIDWPTVEKYNVASKEFLAPKIVIDILREGLKLSNNPIKDQIIWLSRRSDGGNRNVLNEDTVIKTIQDHIDSYGSKYTLTKFIPEDYTYKDTRDLFGRAKAVIGVHGGAFSNIVYCDPGTSIIEFKMLEDYYKYYFLHLSDCCGLPYYPIQLDQPNLFTIPFEIPQQKINNLEMVLKVIL